MQKYDNTYRKELTAKLMSIGTKLSHKRHKILLNQNRCKNCNYFFARFAIHCFSPKVFPKKCPRCAIKNPLENFHDPIDEMVAKVKALKEELVQSF